MSNRAVWLAVALVAVAGIVAVIWWQQKRPTAPTAECTPEGGLRCVEGAIHLCADGVTTKAGDCPGGCDDQDGIARCLAQDGTLTAPPGALCQTGMALCGVDGKSLLVCRDSRLVTGAECPGGCFESDEGGGLYCVDDSQGIRFAEDFPCPKFPGQVRTYACGADGKQLLRCEEGLLKPHTVTCARCDQRRSGRLACTGSDGAVLDPDTGQTIAGN